MTPEQSVQAFEDVHAQVLLPVHNSTFDLAFHPWQEPMARIAKLAEDKHMTCSLPFWGRVGVGACGPLIWRCV
ncbi:hypothetical protein E5CHR_03155 [Variovorax sp. PBL-E5]|nr:hypothetical protein E5CHR_03155 [Variovorax sp. PBL-E5]